MKSARDCWAIPRPTAALVRAAAFTIATAVHLAFLDVIGPLAACSLFFDVGRASPAQAHLRFRNEVHYGFLKHHIAGHLHVSTLVLESRIGSLVEAPWNLEFEKRLPPVQCNQEQRTLQLGKLRMGATMIVPAAQRVCFDRISEMECDDRYDSDYRMLSLVRNGLPTHGIKAPFPLWAVQHLTSRHQASKNRTYCSMRRFNGDSMEIQSCSDLYILHTCKIPKRAQTIQNLLFAVRLAVSKHQKKTDHQLISVVDMEKYLRFQIPLENSQTSMLGKPRTWRKEFAAGQVHRPAMQIAAQINEGWRERL